MLKSGNVVVSKSTGKKFIVYGDQTGEIVSLAVQKDSHNVGVQLHPVDDVVLVDCNKKHSVNGKCGFNCECRSVSLVIANSPCQYCQTLAELGK